MSQRQKAFQRSRRTSSGRTSELQILFIKAVNLLDACIVPVFVFNGAACPAVKHGHAADPPQLRRSFQDLVLALGCYWHEVWCPFLHTVDVSCFKLSHQAPGDAVAELASLNMSGAIDAVLTNGSDAFVFGACCVIQSRQVRLAVPWGSLSLALSTEPRDGPDVVYIHTQRSIQQHPDVSLTREGLLMCAIFAGCGYSKVSSATKHAMSTDHLIRQDGLRGCSTKSAHQLALTEFSEQLFNGGKTLADAELQEFLTAWRNDLRAELSANQRHLLPFRSQKLASNIDDTFPSLSVVKLYTDPGVTGTAGHAPPDHASWVPCCMDAAGLAALFRRKFPRTAESQLQGLLRKHAWPRMYTRRLLQVRWTCLCHGAPTDGT